MKEIFDGRWNIIQDGDMVECCPGMENSRVPYTRVLVGKLLVGEVLRCWGRYVNVLGVETEGDWKPGASFYLKPGQVVVVKNSGAVKEFDLDSFNQMLGIGG